MPNILPPDLIQFDPKRLWEAIEQCQDKARDLSQEADRQLRLAATYRQLLDLYGFTPPAGAVAIRGQPAQEEEPNAKRPKIADVVVEVLAANGGRLHAAKILEQMRGKSILAESRHAMSVLVTAMRRDPRIEKYRRAKNTWQLAETTKS